MEVKIGWEIKKGYVQDKIEINCCQMLSDYTRRFLISNALRAL